MNATHLKLALVALAIATFVASAFVTGQASEGLIGLGIYLAGVLTRRPGDLSAVVHPDDLGGEK